MSTVERMNALRSVRGGNVWRHPTLVSPTSQKSSSSQAACQSLKHIIAPSEIYSATKKQKLFSPTSMSKRNAAQMNAPRAEASRAQPSLNPNPVLNSFPSPKPQKADNTPKTSGSGYPAEEVATAVENPNILVIGGPSGVGKGTVLKLLYVFHHFCGSKLI